MIKTVKLKNQDELLLVLGIQDSKLRALEKEMRVECFIKYNAQEDGAELSVKGTNSRVDKALAKIQKELALSEQKSRSLCLKTLNRLRIISFSARNMPAR